MREEFYRPKIEKGKLPVAVQAKWSLELLEEGYVPFPKKLLRTLTRLFPNDCAALELAAILAIVDFKREGQTRPPSVEFLAYIAGLNASDFTKAVSQMKKKGWVKERTLDLQSKNLSLDGFEQHALSIVSQE